MGWRVMTIVRDPLERLVSGFLNKCREPWRTREPTNCIGFPPRIPDPPTLLSFLMKNNDIKKLSGNQHWIPQSHGKCFAPLIATGGATSGFAFHYTQILNMSDPSFQRDLLNALGDFDMPVKEEKDEKGNFWTKGYYHMPMHHHVSKLLSAGGNNSATKHLTPDAARLALDLYRDDYRHLELPLPMWLPNIGLSLEEAEQIVWSKGPVRGNGRLQGHQAHTYDA